MMTCRKHHGIAPRKWGLLFSTLCLLMLWACTGISPKATPIVGHSDDSFQVDRPQAVHPFASPDQIKAMAPKEEYVYRLGPGDTIDIKVWNRPEISAEKKVVGPDGTISIQRVGIVNVRNRTLQEIQDEITRKLAVLYDRPEVTISIQDFQNNKAFVLGRVVKPGVVNFPGEGTLLEALALAGGLPFHGKETFLTKCAIIRGRDIVIWIDLQDLLNNGNMALNTVIRNNDVIFIPEAEDEMAFVMGEVLHPGAVQLKRGLNLVKAVMLVGGLTSDADPKRVFILRQQGDRGEVRPIDLKYMLDTGDLSDNYTLRANDIVYVSPTGMGQFNYALQQVMPSLQILDMTTTIAETFGLMQELRQQLWGQKGFVSGGGTQTSTTSSEGTQ